MGFSRILMSRYTKCKFKSQNKCDKRFKVRELLQKISIYKLTDVPTCGLHSLKKFRNIGFSSKVDYSNSQLIIYHAGIHWNTNLFIRKFLYNKRL